MFNWIQLDPSKEMIGKGIRKRSPALGPISMQRCAFSSFISTGRAWAFDITNK
jgi:hypothetical protein